jgi:hypothetical protein
MRCDASQPNRADSDDPEENSQTRPGSQAVKAHLEDTVVQALDPESSLE